MPVEQDNQNLIFMKIAKANRRPDGLLIGADWDNECHGSAFLHKYK
jgi:hypothetical protein